MSLDWRATTSKAEFNRWYHHNQWSKTVAQIDAFQRKEIATNSAPFCSRQLANNLRERMTEQEKEATILATMLKQHDTKQQWKALADQPKKDTETNLTNTLPFNHLVTVNIAHKNTPEDVKTICDLWSMQNQKPVIRIVDTGSNPINKKAIEEYDCKYNTFIDKQFLAFDPMLTRHQIEPVSAAMDLCVSMCGTKYAIFTHSDVFIKRRDIIDEMIYHCQTKSPVVGYRISMPRPYDLPFPDMVGHQLLCVDMEVIDCNGGMQWSIRRAARNYGFRDWRQCVCPNWFPDAEILMNLMFHENKIHPYIIGQERPTGVFQDDRLVHLRGLTASAVYYTDPKYNEEMSKLATDVRKQMQENFIDKWLQGETDPPRDFNANPPTMFRSSKYPPLWIN